MMTQEQQDLVRNNIKFAYYMVNKWMKKQKLFRREDLESIACEAICKAAAAYDSSRGCSFINFSKLVINHTIFKEIRDKLLHDKLEAKAAKAEKEGLLTSLIFDENTVNKLDLFKAIKELPRRRQDIVTDYYFNGLSYVEIMLKYQLTKRQVKYALREARESLRQKIA